MWTQFQKLWHHAHTHLRVVRHAHHTVARICYLENYQRYFHATTCQREVLSSSACMYNLDASVFYIVLVLLHEYLHKTAKLLPYTTELSLQTWSISFSQQSQRNDRMFFKTASLQVWFFAINDVIASVVAVKFGKAFCYGQDRTSGNPCAKFCLILINTDGGV